MIKNSFDYIAPESLSDAYKAKKDNEDSFYLAGGTDFLPLLKYDLKQPKLIISLDKIKELKMVKREKKGLYIGAMKTLREAYGSNHITELFPSLSQAARKVASPQIRSIGTIGGNVLQDRRCLYFNQSGEWRKNIKKCFKVGGDICLQVPNSDTCRALYYSDTAPVLMSLDAEIEFFDGKYKRLPIKEVIDKHVEVNGLLKTQDHILTGFFIPYLPKSSWVKFEKFSIRDSLNFPIMNAGIRCSVEKCEPCVKVVIGALSPKPFELADTQALIVEKFNDLEKAKEEIGEFALKELTKKSLVVRETGLSVKAKRNSFKNILNITDDLVSKIQIAKM